jgi:cytosine/adenosine deaminase-related metal-dependent hydrolase
MATAGGAKVLGRNDIGSIETGKAADCFAIRRNSLDLVCAELDPKDLFGTVGYHKPCDLVFVNGVCTVNNGILTRIDEESILQKTRSEINRLLSIGL